MLRSRRCPLCGEEEDVVEIFIGRVPNNMSVRRVIVKGGRRRRLRLFKEDLEDGVVVDFEANADFIMRHMIFAVEGMDVIDDYLDVFVGFVYDDSSSRSTIRG